MPTIIRNGITYGGGGSGSGAIMFDLLWTNASPNSTFAMQTIELDLTGYTAVYFYYKMLASADDSSYGSKLYLINDKDFTLAEGYYDKNNIIFRTAWIDAKGIVFGNAKKNGGSNNSVIIPYKIYGVK